MGPMAIGGALAPPDAPLNPPLLSSLSLDVARRLVLSYSPTWLLASSAAPPFMLTLEFRLGIRLWVLDLSEVDLITNGREMVEELPV